MTLRAARYLGLDPRTVEEMPLYWQNRAITAEQAELEAERLVRKTSHLPGLKPKGTR